MKKGISLIVLVITIIVIIILAGAVILSLANNNPIAQANTAVYKSDRESVQAAVNMFLGAKMAQTKTAATISTPGNLVGVAQYTVGGTTSTFNFSTSGTDPVGITLPVYNQGEVWSIDANGVVTLTIGGTTY